MSHVTKGLCCISCSITWPLGDEELLLLSVNKTVPSVCRAGTCGLLQTAAGTVVPCDAGFAWAEHNSQQRTPHS